MNSTTTMGGGGGAMCSRGGGSRACSNCVNQYPCELALGLFFHFYFGGLTARVRRACRTVTAMRGSTAETCSPIVCLASRGTTKPTSPPPVPVRCSVASAPQIRRRAPK